MSMIDTSTHSLKKITDIPSKINLTLNLKNVPSNRMQLLNELLKIIQSKI